MYFIVKITFKPICCPNYFFVGQKLEIYKQHSKNRVYVHAYEEINGKEIIRGSHNVKLSTLNRCCEKAGWKND